MQTPLTFLRAMIASIVLAMTTLCVTGKLSWAMSGQILGRLNRVRDCLARTAARVEAGRYAPRRRSGKPRPPTSGDQGSPARCRKNSAGWQT